MPKHIVNRMTFHVSAGDERHATRLQDQISRLVRTRLRQELDRTLTRLSPGDEVIRIDKLELDLGQFNQSLDEHSIIRALPKLVEKAVQKQLREHKAKVVPAASATSSRKRPGRPTKNTMSSEPVTASADWHSLPDDYQDFFQDMAELYGDELTPDTLEYFASELAEHEEVADDLTSKLDPYQFRGERYDTNTFASDDEAITAPPTDSELDEWQTLLFYLRTGVMPWWAADNIVPLSALTVNSIEDSHALLELLKHEPTAFTRWCGQTTIAQQATLLSHWPLTSTGLTIATFALMLTEQARHSGFSSSMEPFLQQSWQLIIAGDTQLNDEQQALGYLLQSWRSTPGFSALQQLIKTGLSAPETTALSSAPSLSETQFAAFCQLMVNDASSTHEIPPDFAAQSQQDMATQQQTVSPLEHPSHILGNRWRYDDQTIDAIPVGNAGLVFLFSSLTTLFDSLNWLDDGWFRDESLQQKAVHLLHFIVWGEGELAPEPLEPLLVLNKVLCGLHPSDYVWQDCPLSDAEKQAGTQTLQAFIDGMEGYQFDSVSSLQESLLQRPALFSERAGHWLLRVTPEGRDVLLNQYIQSFSSYLLPWMPVAIDVEWGE